MISLQFLEIFLLIATCALAVFCFVLGRKLRSLNDVEHGIGGAIAVLISEIARLEKAIQSARGEAARASSDLATEIERAKQERAYWVLQQKFTPTEDARPAGLKRRRQREHLGG